MLAFYVISSLLVSGFFFFNDPAITEIYTLSLHDALPISQRSGAGGGGGPGPGAGGGQRGGAAGSRGGPAGRGDPRPDAIGRHRPGRHPARLRDRKSVV